MCEELSRNAYIGHANENAETVNFSVICHKIKLLEAVINIVLHI